ncbi:MAG: hypothetical protein QF898_02325 [SAR202 cluster bacterium]|jgi:hypothetical protein|nr:hypothetical protein [SAR202 cluster bacterium]MDP6714717.1 hypothetical protein [SAR202 cluster bacterium]
MKKRTLILQLVAGGLFFTSIFIPYWFIAMKAPAYPEQMLTVSIHGHKLTGDVDEWHTVSRLVGVKIPPPTPEIDMKLIPMAMIVVAVMAVGTAFIRKRGLTQVLVVLVWIMLAIMFSVLQYRLYMVGHDLDTTAPLRFFVRNGFTPPAIGTVTVGSITSYHMPHVGGIVAFAAAILLTVCGFTPQLAEIWRFITRRPSGGAPPREAAA